MGRMKEAKLSNFSTSENREKDTEKASNQEKPSSRKTDIQEENSEIQEGTQEQECSVKNTGSQEAQNSEYRGSELRRDSNELEKKIWRLARSYEREHIVFLKKLYIPETEYMITQVLLQRTKDLKASESTKRRRIKELNEDGLVDYVEGSPSFVNPIERLQEPVQELVDVWNRINEV